MYVTPIRLDLLKTANQISCYLLVTKGNLTLFFFYKGINSTTADESSPLVPTRCLVRHLNKVIIIIIIIVIIIIIIIGIFSYEW